MVDLKPTELVTPPVRLAFPALFEPKPVSKTNTTKKTFQATLLLPPDMDLTPFKRCMIAAIEEKFGKAIKIRPDKIPLKSCDDYDYNGFDDGWYFIRTSTQYQPTVIDQGKKPVLDPDALVDRETALKAAADRVFPGCWVRVHVKAYAWDHPEGGRGVSFGLNSVQLIRNDERLDGRRNANELFDVVEVEEDPFDTAGGSDADGDLDIFG